MTAEAVGPSAAFVIAIMGQNLTRARPTSVLADHTEAEKVGQFRFG